MYSYKTKGTCSSKIDIEIVDGILTRCIIHGGCRGNTVGLARMVEGRKVEDIKNLLRGIPCRGNTSCPDQIVCAIEAYEAEEK
ncbi:MAG: TIGR03905 family TSCPD domain-containing protein [Clostridia bacterium]|nr:TIGR03905 family TSCPD domain-containing protein [Clostridia bacterium]